MEELEDEGQGCSQCIYATSQWESCPRQGGQLICILNGTYWSEEEQEDEP